MLVIVGPGATAFTRMLCGAYMNADDLGHADDRVLRRGVGEARRGSAQRGLGGDVDDRAGACASIAGMTARVSLKVPVTLTFMTRSQTLSLTSCRAVMSSMIPATLARPSMRSPAALTIFLTSPSSVMSPTRVTTSLPGVLGLELVEALLRDVDRDHAAALAGDAGCGGAADSGAGAGDDDGLAVEATGRDLLDPLGRRLGDSSTSSSSEASVVPRHPTAPGRPTSPAALAREVVDHLLRERALAHRHEALEGQAADRLERVGVWPACASRSRMIGPPVGWSSQVAIEVLPLRGLGVLMPLPSLPCTAAPRWQRRLGSLGGMLRREVSEHGGGSDGRTRAGVGAPMTEAVVLPAA